MRRRGHHEPVTEELFLSWLLEDERGCWIWQRGKSLGYGALYLPEGVHVHAHRFAYELWVGPISSGQFVLHNCDIRACCNPDHLRTGTHEDNMQDMRDRGGQVSGERHGNAKLTQSDVAKIRSSTESHVMVAKRYKVDASHIAKIRRHTRW